MIDRPRSLKWQWPVLAIATLLGGCYQPGETDEVAVNVGTRALPLPDSASPDRSCSIPATLPPGGLAAVDSSMTPRSDASAEILAMEASGEVVAPTDLYERVAYEFASFRDVGFYWKPSACAAGLLVGMTDAGIQQVESGAYTSWDDYNTALKMTSKRLNPTLRYYKLGFNGVYNIAALEQGYAGLPEVRYAEGNSYVGGNYDVCLERFGDAQDTHVYIFWQGSGDCPAGCIQNTYWGFAAYNNYTMEFLGRRDPGEAEPDWFAKARQCRSFL